MMGVNPTRKMETRRDAKRYTRRRYRPKERSAVCDLDMRQRRIRQKPDWEAIQTISGQHGGNQNIGFDGEKKGSPLFLFPWPSAHVRSMHTSTIYRARRTRLHTRDADSTLGCGCSLVHFLSGNACGIVHMGLERLVARQGGSREQGRAGEFPGQGEARRSARSTAIGEY
jgi:hypothetical protein